MDLSTRRGWPTPPIVVSVFGEGAGEALSTAGKGAATATRLALLTMAGGFLFEAGAEIYQLSGAGQAGPIALYYVGLVTTGLGFYLMYRGRKEWSEHHRKSVLRGHRHLRVAVGTFVGAVVAIALVSIWRGGGAAPGVTSVLGWVVGGLVALSFGNFFLGLTLLADRLVAEWARWVAWAAFAWSLGVAGLTGYLVGGSFVTLLDEFFSNPLKLVVSFAPLAFAISPLFVAYLLYVVAYLNAVLRLRGRPAGASPAA